MEKCNGCEYEYDGICKVTGMECNEMVACTMVTNKAKEHKEQNKQDNVNHPKHYEGHCSIECIDNMRLIFGNQIVADYCMVNAYKYLSRHKYKNGYEDLCKAKWYIDKAEELELTDKATINSVAIDELDELCREYMEGYKNE